LILLVIAASVQYVAHYVLVPAYINNTGAPYLVGYLWAWGSTMAMVFAASLVVYRLEDYPASWAAFSDRYWLNRMPGQDWLWSLAVLVVAAATFFGLSFTGRWLSQILFLAPHPVFPPDRGLGGEAYLIPGRLFGMSLKGQWWVLWVYLLGWVLNVFGEELFYRGWMLPRQEISFGAYAWLVNGTVFAFQHMLQPWNILAIWPGALFMAWVVQRRRNTWIGILQHGLMNLSLFVFVVRGVSG
jgi:membrane protease YdiL (CAAX protease family)